MKMYILISVLILSFAAGIVIAGSGDEADTVKTVPEGDDSARKLDMKVREILRKSCAASTCHGGENPKMHLSLETGDIPENMIGVASRQNGNLMLIDTKDPSQSYLLLKITGGEGIKGKKMPIMMAPLTEDNLTDVMTWVSGFAVAEESKADEKETEDDD